MTLLKGIVSRQLYTMFPCVYARTTTSWGSSTGMIGFDREELLIIDQLSRKNFKGLARFSRN